MKDIDPATITVLVTALTGIGGALAGILRELVKSRATIRESPLGAGLVDLTEKIDTLNAVVLRHIAQDHGAEVWPAKVPPPPAAVQQVRRRRG